MSTRSRIAAARVAHAGLSTVTLMASELVHRNRPACPPGRRRNPDDRPTVDALSAELACVALEQGIGRPWSRVSMALFGAPGGHRATAAVSVGVDRSPGPRPARGEAPRCRALSRSILSQACSTVEWSRPPSSVPMRSSETSVSARIRYMAIWRGTTMARSRFCAAQRLHVHAVVVGHGLRDLIERHGPLLGVVEHVREDGLGQLRGDRQCPACWRRRMMRLSAPSSSRMFETILRAMNSSASALMGSPARPPWPAGWRCASPGRALSGRRSGPTRSGCAAAPRAW